MRRASPDAGFSLLELVVSLALLGLISAFAMGGVRLGARVWEAQSVSEDAGDLQLLGHHLRRWLEAAQPFQTIVDGERGPVGFIGEPKRLAFVIAEDGRGDRPGLYQYTIQLDEAAARQAFRRATDLVDGRALVLQRQRMPQAGLFPEPGEGETHLLSAAVTSVKFSYFGRDIGEPAASWRGEWRDKARLPRLIRITLELQSGPTATRELVIAVRGAG